MLMTLQTRTRRNPIGRRLRWMGASVLAAALLGCGGGGDDSTTPSVPSNLSQTSSEASKAAEFGVGSAYDLANKSLLTANNPILNVTLGGAAAAAAMQPRSKALQAKPLAVYTPSCSELGVFSVGCTGTVSIDTSIPFDATIIPANSFLSFTFNKINGQVEGQTLAFDGQMRVDFLTAIDDTAPTLASVSYKVTLSSFTATFGNITVGPETSSVQVDFDAQGAVTLTTGDNVFSKITGLSTTDLSNYSVATAQVRKAYWGDASNKIDANLSNWKVEAGRPAVGSSTSMSASNGATAKVEVSSSSATSVVYAVQITASGATKRYTVTATYPAGSNTPTYAAVDAP